MGVDVAIRTASATLSSSPNSGTATQPDGHNGIDNTADNAAANANGTAVARTVARLATVAGRCTYDGPVSPSEW